MTIVHPGESEETIVRAEKAFNAWASHLVAKKQQTPLRPYDADADWSVLTAEEQQAWIAVVKRTDRYRTEDKSRPQTVSVLLFDNDDGTIARQDAIRCPDEHMWKDRYVIGTVVYTPEATRNDRIMFLTLDRLVAHATEWADARRGELRKLSSWLDDQGTGRK